MTKPIYIRELRRLILPGFYGLLMEVKKLYPDGEFALTEERLLIAPALASPGALAPLEAIRRRDREAFGSGLKHVRYPPFPSRCLHRMRPAPLAGPLDEAQTWLDEAVAIVNHDLATLWKEPE